MTYEGRAGRDEADARPAEGRYDLALRIYDLMQYQDESLAKQYVRSEVYRKDSAATSPRPRRWSGTWRR